MNQITPQDLKSITSNDFSYCVSITMEAAPIVGGSLENPIKLRNLLGKAKEKLIEAGLSNKKADTFLSSAFNIVDDSGFWRDQFSALLIYITDGQSHAYKLPLVMGDRVLVSRKCYILPLVEYLNKNQSYYILHLDEGGNKLYEATPFGVAQIELPELDLTIEELMANYEIEEEQFFHVERSGGRVGSHEGIIFHGHGNAKDDKKNRQRQLLKIIEPTLSEYFSQKPKPVILAGHDDMVAEYKNISKNANILGRTLRFDIAQSNPNVLLSESLKIITEHFAKLNEALFEHFANLQGTGKTTSSIEDIIVKALEGKVETLFITKDDAIFGQISEENDKMSVAVTDNEADEDLINFAAFQTIKNSGKVILKENTTFPECRICAILRY